MPSMMACFVWKKTLENNGTVQVKIEPIYSGNSKRPYRFIVYEQINNGQENIIRFKNTETGD